MRAQQLGDGPPWAAKRRASRFRSNLQLLWRALPPTCRKLAALAEESSSATIAPFELLLFWCSHTDTKFSFWKHFSNGTFQLPRLWARNPAADQG